MMMLMMMMIVVLDRAEALSTQITRQQEPWEVKKDNSRGTGSVLFQRF